MPQMPSDNLDPIQKRVCEHVVAVLKDAFDSVAHPLHEDLKDAIGDILDDKVTRDLKKFDFSPDIEDQVTTWFQTHNIERQLDDAIEHYFEEHEISDAVKDAFDSYVADNGFEDLVKDAVADYLKESSLDEEIQQAVDTYMEANNIDADSIKDDIKTAVDDRVQYKIEELEGKLEELLSPDNSLLRAHQALTQAALQLVQHGDLAEGLELIAAAQKVFEIQKTHGAALLDAARNNHLIL